MSDVSYWVALFSGFLYFFSPCVLPLIPSFLSFISGVSFQDLKSSPERVRYKVLLNTIIFFLGFSFIFISLGLGASALGGYVFRLKFPVQKIGALIIIVLGIYILFQNKIKLFLSPKSLVPLSKPLGFLGTFFVGSAFAFSWSACATPILSAILVSASVKANFMRGFVLLALFSLGLGVPFLISAFSLSLFLSLFQKVRANLRIFEIIAGLVLILYGSYILSGRGL